ncbi:MAG: transposase [Oscillospiraceae bacterium]
MKHMIMDIRKRIEFLIGCGFSLPKVAGEIGRATSTVRNELIKHRIASDKGYGCTNRLCAHFDECARTSFDGFGDRKRKCQPKCFTSCPDFREASCPRLANPPFVCNGCGKERGCPLMKKFYIASVAQAQYESERSLSRTGVHPDRETIAGMNDVPSPCIRRGQSPAAVIASNARLFGGYAKSTIYGWIADGLFSAKKHDLPFAGTRGKPHRRPEAKTDAKCRIKRTIQDMRNWFDEHVGQVVTCEFDTVVGSIGGKALFTMTFPETGLSLAFLRDRRSSQTCTRMFNMLREIAGPGLFRKLFLNSLTDNGTRFSDPVMIENYRPDPEHNPTKLLPRGIHVWFADPHCPSQKPHIERFHNELRRILPKGTSFDPLTQEKINLTLSHLNSYPREATGWKAPCDLFVGRYGEEGRAFLGRLGIVRVPANQVTLHPFLLGERYQKAADMATLRKNGATATAKPAAGK